MSVQRLHDEKLEPFITMAPVNGEMTECINTDGIILMAKRGVSAESKNIYRRYRRILRNMVVDGRPADLRRADAILAALFEAGIPVEISKGEAK